MLEFSSSLQFTYVYNKYEPLTGLTIDCINLNETHQHWVLLLLVVPMAENTLVPLNAVSHVYHAENRDSDSPCLKTTTN